MMKRMKTPNPSLVPLPRPPRLDDLDHIYHALMNERMVRDVLRYQIEYLCRLNWKLDVLARRLNLEKLFDISCWHVEPEAPLPYFTQESSDEDDDKAKPSGPLERVFPTALSFL
ncbi:hypothetical protein ACH5RR_026248 [Cinchona calisaya]|uniref:Uncharacterized protein n=1 Tax=Cinchona calisaya TaxID=153742 RepID=A0ABD2Z215_9GENT